MAEATGDSSRSSRSYSGSRARGNQVTTTLRELIDLGLRWNWPVGFHLEYNDGASGRASGYYESPSTVDYTIQKPSFHELAEARQELVQILTERGLKDEAKRLLLRGD